eukprot:jgi/Mesvir1/10538/Mv21773-RA.1
MGVSVVVSPPPVASMPGFEGYEKRLELAFRLPSSGATLRDLTRTQLDEMLRVAECTIISQLSNAAFDAYVLSESSLFVHPSVLILKTCGTTALLKAAPVILQMARALGLEVKRVMYSRGSFLFPEIQPFPHCSFDLEAAFLEEHFGHLSGGSSAYLLGNALGGDRWHVYVAHEEGHGEESETEALTVEICCTDLHVDKAAQFFRSAHADQGGDGALLAQHVTRSSGVSSLLPQAAIDAYLFEPCGYSMNGMEGAAHSTIHITPEAGFSYASLELGGYGGDVLARMDVLAKAIEIFHPGRISIAITAWGKGVPSDVPWRTALAKPQGYRCAGISKQELPFGGVALFQSFTVTDGRLLRTPSVTAIPLASGTLPSTLTPSDSCGDLSRPLVVAKGGSGVPNCANPGGAPAKGRPSSPLPGSEGAAEDSGDEGDGHVCELLALKKQMARINAQVAAGSMCGGAGGAPKAAGPTRSLEQVLRRFCVDKRSGPSAHAAIRAYVAQQGAAQDESFHVVNLAVIKQRHELWRRHLARVQPLYAVKCNADPAVLATLAALGAGFSAADRHEIERVLHLGVDASRDVLFASPCKVPSHVAHARDRGVSLLTFDSACELRKVSAIHPQAQLLMRIRVDGCGGGSMACPLGAKYGAEEEEVDRLLAVAGELGLDVAGVSFHVGSGSTDPTSYARAIRTARAAFDAARRAGFDPHVLDIGGGFSGGGLLSDRPQFSHVARVISGALEEHFPCGGGGGKQPLRVVAEPGRFFAESCASLACNVFGRRVRHGRADRASHEYWISEGLYGCLGPALMDRAVMLAAPLPLPGRALPSLTDKQGPRHRSTVFGPSGDGLDQVLCDFWLPELEIGDWLIFPDMGAYTMPGEGKGVATAYLWVDEEPGLEEMRVTAGGDEILFSDGLSTCTDDSGNLSTDDSMSTGD